MILEDFLLLFLLNLKIFTLENESRSMERQECTGMYYVRFNDTTFGHFCLPTF